MREGRGEEIKLAGLEFGRFDTPIDLHHPALGFAEQAENVRNIKALLKLNQVGGTDPGDVLGAIDRVLKVSVLVHESQSESLGPGEHPAIGVLFPIAIERPAAVLS